MLDVYTKKPIVTLSDEHVLLNALGGRKVARDLIDKTTNDIFGHTIDAALADAVLPVRVLMDAKAADGTAAPALRGMQTAEGERYNLLPGGPPELAAPRAMFTPTEGGGMNVVARARSMEELRRLVARKFAQHGIPMSALDAVTPVRERAPKLAGQIKFGLDAWRGLTKMACNLLAIRRRELFLDTAFDAVRNFVLDGGADAWDFVAPTATPLAVAGTPNALGPLDHFLVVHGDAATGAVRGLVVLYGHLQIVVKLGTANLPTSFVTTYRIDQLGGADRFDGEDATSVVPPPFVPMRDADQAAWFAAWSDPWSKVMKVAGQVAREGALHRLIALSIDEVVGPADGRPVTRAEIDDLTRRAMERAIEHLRHLGFIKNSG